jgi:predicted Ser/Thr protein kinase
MPWAAMDIGEDELVRWIERSIADASHILAQGYQGQVYLYQDGRQRYVIKAASGRGVLRWLRTHMLRQEFSVYNRLQGYSGSPRCYGLLRGRYLVLEYVDGLPLRHAPIADRALFYQTLFDQIQELHARGVAHSDLKRKDNLLVVAGRRPCLIDFGAAIVRKPGFAPLNHFLFRMAVRFDFNAWIKLKYNNRLEEISATDSVYYRRTWVEKSARRTKRVYKRIKSWCVAPKAR